MKKIMYSVSLLSVLGYAGGNIGQENLDQSITQDDVNQANKVIVIAPEKVVKELIKPEVPKIKALPSKYYIGLSGANTNVNTENSTVVLKNGHPLIAVGKIGYNIIDNLAVEARAGLGIKKDTISSVTSDLDKLVGAYVKPNVNVSENINLFGLLGYAKAKHILGGESLVTSGLSYGVGLNYKLNSDWDMVADAVRYGKEDTTTIDAYSLGLEYSF